MTASQQFLVIKSGQYAPIEDALAINPNIAHMFTACGIHEVGKRIVAGADCTVCKIYRG